MTGRGWSVALLLVVLLGYGLRIYRLDAQSMWSDEGLSYYRATLPLEEVLANIADLEKREL